jgi:4-amino-4-deoxy-L-arabinose transferase-like glycosyltransferase
MSSPRGQDAASPASPPLAVLGVLAVALAFRLYGLSDNMLYDPLAYAQYAYNLLQGTFTLTDDYAFAHRLTVIAPVAVLYAWLGVGPLSSHLWPLLASLGQVAAVMWLGTRLLDRATGIVAGLLLALFPLDVLAATRLAPDAVIASFLTLSAAAWIAGTARGGLGGGALSFLAGVALALAVLTRMYAALLVVFLAGSHFLWRRLSWRAVLWAVLGGAAVALPLGWLYFAETGSPLYPIQVQAEAFGRQSDPRGPQLFYYFWHLLHPRTTAGLFGAFFLLAALAALLRPRRERLLLLLWILPFFLYLQFGSMSLTRYEPVWKTLRYLTPLFAPSALLLATLSVEAVRGREFAWLGRVRLLASAPARARVAVVFSLLLAVQSFAIVSASRERDRRTAAAFQSAVALLERSPDLPILFDHWRSGIAFAYYFRFRQGARFYHDAADSLRIGEPGDFSGSRFGYLAWYDDPSRIPEAFAVVYDGVVVPARAAGSPPARYLGVVVPRFVHDPPADWRLVEERQGLRIYRVPPPRGTGARAAPALAGTATSR